MNDYEMILLKKPDGSWFIRTKNKEGHWIERQEISPEFLEVLNDYNRMDK